MYRTKILLFLLLFGLSSSVCGLSQLQAAEGAITTLQWDCPKWIDCSSLIAYCFFKSHQLFEIAEGEWKSTHLQFLGRVEWDVEALKEGQVRVHLTALKMADSGMYWCYMYANYDREEGQWTCKTDEYFMLKVMRKEHIELAIDNQPGHSNAGFAVEYKSDLGLVQKIILVLMFGSMVILATCIAVFTICHHLGFYRTKEALIPV